MENESEAETAAQLDRHLERLAELLPDLAGALVLLLAFVLVGWIIGRALGSLVRRRGDRIHANFVSRLPVWIFAFLGVLLATDLLGWENLAAGLLAGGGMTALILGFAFRGVGENFLAGFFLVFSRPFRIGDLIQSGDLPQGAVTAVDLRNTHVRTADGRDIYIPNSIIFNSPLINFTRDGLRRPTFTLGVDYRAPLPEVRAAIVAQVAGLEGVLETPEPRVTIASYEATHVMLEVWVWIDTFRGADFALVRTAAMEAARSAVLDNGWKLSADVSSAVELVDGRASESGR